MQNSFSSIFKKWLFSVDRVILFTIIGIIIIGICVSIASTPGVALKLGLPPFHFVKQHLLLIPISVSIIILISFLNVRSIRKLAIFGYALCLILVVGTLFFGSEIKGARRWLNIFGFSLQPSEFFKPILAVTTAWLISEQYRDRKFPGILLSFVALAFVIPLLLSQPDVGMTFVIVTTWAAQLFISGLSIVMILIMALSAVGALFGMYFILPHFADRVNKFFMNGGDDVDVYQIQKSLDAFKSGGLFGKGPGEGTIKTILPDSHSDFVFSVIGEEFGFIVCLVVIALFVVLASRSLTRISQSSSIFSFATVFGITFQIILQVFINVSTSLNLIPTKGMTIPFISYGGSSLISSSISIGILLALTKKSVLSENT